MMTAIFAFFVLICVLVFVHEYGHFWAARRCGVKVIRFSIGFGKVLFRKMDKQGTEFAFSLIPLGGYVQMYNKEAEFEGKPEEALDNKTILQRAFIIVAGPVANFLFAIVAYWFVFVSGMPSLKPVVGEVIPDSIVASAKLPVEFEFKKIAGQEVRDWEEVSLSLVGNVGKQNVLVEGVIVGSDSPQHFSLDLSRWNVDGTKENPLLALGIRPKSSLVKPEIAKVLENSPAYIAEVRAQDKILSIDGKPFDWLYLTSQVKGGRSIALVVERNGEQKRFVLTPEKRENRFIIGLVPSYEPLADKYRTVLQYDPVTAIWKAIEKVASLCKTILQFLGNLITGDLSVKNMGGPISMAKGAAASLDISLIYYVSFMALISVNLGVMNLFPILPLDGGQLIVLGVEALKDRNWAEQIRQYFQTIGMWFVLGLMAFAFINDIIHF